MDVGRPGVVVPLPEALESREGNLEPFEWLRERREAGPVQWDPDRGCWDVFTHEAVEAVLTDPETFSNERIVGESVVFKDTLLGLDPPEHTEKRSMVEEYFTPGAVREYEDDVRATAERLVDEALIDGATGRFDVVDAIAYPLPITTIAHLLGASESRREEMKQVSDQAIAGPQLSGAEDVESFLEDQGEAVVGIGELISDIVVEKRANPGDGLVSDLVHGDEDLSHYEMLRLCGLLLVAGHVTTTNLIANTVRILAERPDAMASVQSAIAEGDDAALDRLIEESLRFRSPVQLATRIATTDATVAGREISAGEPVVTWLQAANRDPAVFDEPESFDPTRDPNPNVAFGRGIHVCLGAHLARLEAKIVVEALFDRVERLDLVETTYEPVEAGFLHGVQSLPVRYRCTQK